MKRLHPTIYRKKQRTPLIDPRIRPRNLSLAEIKGNLGLALDKTRSLLPPRLKARKPVKRHEEFVRESELLTHHRKGIRNRETSP
jgi:hypothetical protein